MKKESKVNQAKYVELNLFTEEKEDHQKDSISSEDMESDTSPDKEYDLTDLFERLSKSTFRSRFHLSKKDKEYIAEKGLATIRKHAEDFVAKRLAAVVDVSFIAVYTDSFNPQYNKVNRLITSLYYRLSLNLSLNIAISLAGI